MSILKQLLTRGGAEERRHREQIHEARKQTHEARQAVRWAQIGVVIAAVGITITVFVAWFPQHDTETRSQSSADPTSSRSNADEPITVAVETFKDHCNLWFVPRPVDKIEFNSGDETAIDWTDLPAGDGGAPAGPFFLFFTVQGRTEVDVVLTDLDIDVVERRPAPAGVALQDPCGDEGAFRWLGIDLDVDPPQVISHFSAEGIDPADETITEQERQPVQFPYHVSSTDAEVFSAVAYAVNCDCEWTIELSWQSQGQSGTMIIDDNGRPFRTVGMSNAIATCTGDGSCGPVPDYYDEMTRPPDAHERDVVIQQGGE